MLIKNLKSTQILNNRIVKIKFKQIAYILMIILFALALFIQSAAAFSGYEKDVSERLYQDLNEEYTVTEFSENSLEYQTLKQLEANIIDDSFRDKEFTVHHVDDEIINAYYIGAGNIMLFEGLLQELHTEDQLAALIAHEMGHGVKEHFSKSIERNIGLSFLNILFNHFTDNQYQQMTNIAQNLIQNGYSREQEEEADIYAVDIMMRSGYNPRGLIELMEIFKERSHNVKLLEFTQTHPIPQSRIDYIEKYIAEKEAEMAAKSNGNEAGDFIRVERSDLNQFENNLIKFYYPSEWELNEERSVKEEVEFNYNFNSEGVKGNIYFEDLSSKSFMDTARKHFNYAVIEAEDAGYQIDKREIEDEKLNIYQLQLTSSEEFKLNYYINQKNKQQLLKLSFELEQDNRIQQMILIEELIESIQFK